MNAIESTTKINIKLLLLLQNIKQFWKKNEISTISFFFN